jgi:GxxExxY protein
MNELSETIIAAATERHRELGAWLVEGSDETCLAHELNLQGIQADRQKMQPIHYQGLKTDEASRIDPEAEDQIISGFQAVYARISIHMAQLLTDLQAISLHARLSEGFQCGITQNARFESSKITQLPNSIFHSASSANAADQSTQPKSQLTLLK